MAKGFAKAFYSSTAWEKCRDGFMASKNYLCERCGDLAVICHHKRYITPNNINDPNVTLNWDNLECLCRACHSIVHGNGDVLSDGLMFDKNGDIVRANNVYLVCGSPGSGKTSYVLSHKKSDDLIFDMDFLCAALTGNMNDIHSEHEAVLSTAIEIRTLIYDIIRARRGKWHNAYVITATSDKAKLQTLAQKLNAKVIMIDTPLDECIKRIHADERRAGKERMFEDLAIKWHEAMKGPPG